MVKDTDKKVKEFWKYAASYGKTAFIEDVFLAWASQADININEFTSTYNKVSQDVGSFFNKTAIEVDGIKFDNEDQFNNYMNSKKQQSGTTPEEAIPAGPPEGMPAEAIRPEDGSVVGQPTNNLENVDENVNNVNPLEQDPNENIKTLREVDAENKELDSENTVARGFLTEVEEVFNEVFQEQEAAV